MRVSIPLSVQQEQVLRAVAARRGETVDAVVARALRAVGAVQALGGNGHFGSAPAAICPSALSRIEPGTGAGLVVRRGEVLRVEQLLGDQGVDVELFALRDRRLRLDAGRTRSLEGARPRLGTTLWSAPPDELALAAIVADSAPGHDLLYPACSEREYELATGCPGHASCRSIELAVARAWGLDERDLHDPLNLWLEAGVHDDGALWWRHARSGPGDHVELLAQTDLLAIVNPCANDLFGEHRFEVRPVLVGIRPASADERSRWLAGPQPEPAADAIRPLPGAEPEFDLQPLRRVELSVDLPPDVAEPGLDGEALRTAFFRWWAATEAASVPFARER